MDYYSPIVVVCDSVFVVVNGFLYVASEEGMNYYCVCGSIK